MSRLHVDESRLTLPTFINGLTKSSRAAQRQSYALALGAIDYSKCPRIIQRAVDALLLVLDGGSSGSAVSLQDVAALTDAACGGHRNKTVRHQITHVHRLYERIPLLW